MIVQENQTSVSRWINVSVKNGFVVGKNSVPLETYLFTEGLISKEMFDQVKGKPFSISFKPYRLEKDTYEFQGETKTTLELRGVTEINGELVGVCLKVGFNTVSASYLLSGLLMSSEPFNSTLKITPAVTPTKSGRSITKLWVSSEKGQSDITFDQIRDFSDDFKLQMLIDRYPSNVQVDLTEESPF